MNMFSNKFEKRSHAFALDFVFYNFAAIMRPLGVTFSCRLDLQISMRAPPGNLTVRRPYRKKVTKFQTETRPDKP
jgi:hypothetical protein